ncbi:hypothetical protein [Rhizobium freirei]|uniref:hypothetical protein n=1 Tax=Rhizobium freirei TaxID=1353277 RepID=UPI001427B8A6|nr:hypothetical protein [Rhizobium freirei]
MTDSIKDNIPSDIREAAANALNIAEDMTGSLFCERVDVIARAILSERERDGWRPMETAPKSTRTEILIATKYGIRIAWWGAAKYNRKTKDYDLGWTSGMSYGFEPTGWMPLPIIPKAESSPPVTLESEKDTAQRGADVSKVICPALIDDVGGE